MSADWPKACNWLLTAANGKRAISLTMLTPSDDAEPRVVSIKPELASNKALVNGRSLSPMLDV
jgi:hypothetical protein